MIHLNTHQTVFYRMPLRRGPRLLRSRKGKRGVSPIIGTVLLVAITVVLAAILYAVVQMPLSPPPPVIGVQAFYNDSSFTVYGEDNGPYAPQDQCPAATHNVCTMPGSMFVITQVQGVIPLGNVQVLFFCNGELAQSGSLLDLFPSQANSSGPGGGPGTKADSCPDQVSGSSGPGPGPGPGPGGGGPGGGSGGSCLNWPAWGAGLLNHLMYFVPESSTEQVLHAGDYFVVYGSACHVTIDKTVGDDFYGPPTECVVTPGLCVVKLLDGNNIIGVLQFAQGAP